MISIVWIGAVIPAQGSTNSTLPVFKQKVFKQKQLEKKQLEQNKNTILEKTTSERLPDAVERYQEMLKARQEKLSQSKFLPEDTKKNLQANFQAETSWLQDKAAELAATDNIEERKAIQEEIRAHIQNQREERRQLIEKNLTAPSGDGLQKAEIVSSKFNTIVDTFTKAGIDTAELEQIASNYSNAVQEANTIQGRLEEQPTIEDIKAMREQIAKIRQLASDLRNQVQTILSQANKFSN